MTLMRSVMKREFLKPPALGIRLQRAFKYAAEKHDGQVRKQTAVPYLSHLMAVTSLVFEGGGDEDMGIAGLLHDVVEDCGGMPRLREIRRMFGARVAKIVEGCTDSFSDPKLAWAVRKSEYLKKLKHEDSETRLVSAADKLHNVRTVLADYRQDGESIWQRFSGGREGTLWYYRALSDEFQRKNPNRITRELAIAVAELEKAVEVNSGGTASEGRSASELVVSYPITPKASVLGTPVRHPITPKAGVLGTPVRRRRDPSGRRR
jgi:(p)ppGpp synthase/HD superfamily hydrolase